MSEQTARKLNINVLSVPKAFLGKERDRQYGSANFLQKNGKRLASSEIFALSLMHTESIIFGSLNLTPYSAFTDTLNFSRPTVGKSLNGLITEGIIEKKRQSKYEIQSRFSDRKTVTIYQFLLEERLDLGGVVRRLTKNEVLYLSMLIAHYNNDNNKGKYFVGGVTRVATALNVSKSTASYIIDRLIKTKTIFRKSMIIDSAGNEVITNGKGSSKKALTVYEVNGEILRRCRAIEKERAELRTVKKLYGQSRKKVPYSPAPAQNSNNHKKYSLADNSYNFDKLHADFDNSETVRKFKLRYKQLENTFLKALYSGTEQEQDELENEMSDLQAELREYLIRHGAPPDIPKNLIEYIKY